jgi:hypothetical protein
VQRHNPRWDSRAGALVRDPPPFTLCFPCVRVFPRAVQRSGILSVHEDEPLAPPAGGAFFMRCLLCATGAASAALTGGFAGQRLEPVLSQVAGNGCQVGKPATPLS